MVTVLGYGLLESAKYERQANDNSHEYAKYTSDKVAEACVGIARIEKVVCLNEAIDAQHEYETNQQDLAAQKTSALWAYIMGAAAVIGMALSAVGVWLIKATFDETQRTAQIAQNNLDAYRDLEAGRLAAKFEWGWAGQVSVKWHNFGSSDITVLLADITSFQFEAGKIIALPTKISERDYPRHVIVAPSFSYDFETLRLDENGICTIAGGVIYCDIFGRLHLCKISRDVIAAKHQGQPSSRIDHAKWEKALNDFKVGREVTQSTE